MCYKGSMDRATGDVARLECEAIQALLASVHDEETAIVILNLMAGGGGGGGVGGGGGGRYNSLISASLLIN